MKWSCIYVMVRRLECTRQDKGTSATAAARFSPIVCEGEGCSSLVDVVLDGQQVVSHGLQRELVQQRRHAVEPAVQHY